MLKALSLGAGVQSSALALMASEGLLGEQPDFAVFADTGWEPSYVYEWLAQLERMLRFPVYKVRNGNIRKDIIKAVGDRSIKIRTPPFFVKVEGRQRASMLLRQCTHQYKIKPIHEFIRKRLESSGDVVAELWIGISVDEAHRMKPSNRKYIVHKYPLVEMTMSRIDCLSFFKERRLPLPPKSSCIGCPYHSDKHWIELKKSHKDWQDAVMIDRLIRNGISGSDGPLFLHRSLMPLDKVPINAGLFQDLFGDECEGLCGL